MALTADQISKLNKMNPTAAKTSLGTVLAAAETGAARQAALVAPAAGANPTKAEFDGLLTALKNAGLMSLT